jgi:hypothetical protein
MVRIPRCAAKITELVPTKTGHVRTALSPLHHELAFLTPSELEMLLQKISFPIVFALPEVLLHETFGTVLNSASHADDWVIVGEDIPRAFLIKAEYFMRIFFDRVSDQNVVIFFPILDCQISDDF